MKIFKISQQQGFLLDDYNLDFSMDDYLESYSEQLSEIINSFVIGEGLSFYPVNINRLKPIYRHFVTRNFLNDADIKNLHKVIHDIAKNVARLRATTSLSEHNSQSIEEIFENEGFGNYFEGLSPEEHDEAKERFFNFLEWDGKNPISDYGLPKLEKFLGEIATEHNPIKQLILLNQLLDVIHQRNDLASFLVKGGSASLSELSSLEV